MPNKHAWRYRLPWVAGLVAIVGAAWGVFPWLATAPASATRAELVRRDGVMFRPEATQPFSGLLVEEWRPGVRRTEVTLRDGRADGRSRGWHENGRLEVEETFVRGVSHGIRTRWYADGTRKSQVKIRAGRLVGTFREWHSNGQLARETPLAAGVGHGRVRAWDAEGHSAGVAIVEHGTLLRRE
jgi:hypothetical protein